MMGFWVRLAVGVGLAVALLAPAPPAGATAPSVSPFASVENDVMGRINAARLQRGVPSVDADGQLGAIAYARSADMVARAYFSHVNPDCGAQADRWLLLPAVGRIPCNVLALLDEKQVPYQWAGEILEWNLFLTQMAQDQADVRAVGDFLHSPAHRDILLDPRFNRAGTGVAIGSDRKMLLTVIFIQVG